jgi:hypothetical protein
MPRRYRRKNRVEFPQEWVEQSILLACNGAPNDTLVARIRDHLKVEPAVAEKLAREAREAIHAAAGVNLAEEVGRGVLRLGRLLDGARINGDGRLQLNVLKELHRLLGLHAPPRVDVPPEPPVSPLEKAVANYLGPLGILPGGASPEELVRIAAQRLIDGDFLLSDTPYNPGFK